MMAKSIWKGHINYGAMSFGVKMYSAVQEKTVHFRQLHKECNTPIQLPKYCPECERQLDGGEIVKGYEIAKGQYIMLTEEELGSLPVKTLKQIEILGFAKDSIDPRAFEKPYYLSPEEIGGKAFELLRKGMEDRDVVAVAKLTYREKEHIAVLQSLGKIILLRTLHYADEIRDTFEVEPERQPALAPKEEEIIGLLIDRDTMVFEHSVFQDEYRLAVETLVEAKLLGKEIPVASPDGEQPAGDLMDQLVATLKAK
jgi:DNA end-binding protein Ku